MININLEFLFEKYPEAVHFLAHLISDNSKLVNNRAEFMSDLVRAADANHYKWGSDCDGWHLLRADTLSVIEERMPAGSAEQRHFHSKSRQFFYVLEGELTMEVDGRLYSLQARQGLEIAPGQPHQALNRSVVSK